MRGGGLLLSTGAVCEILEVNKLKKGEKEREREKDGWRGRDRRAITCFSTRDYIQLYDYTLDSRDYTVLEYI